MFEFGYRVVGSGWSETRVVDDKNHAVLVARISRTRSVT